MPRKAKAALCRAHNAPVVVETIAVDAPKRGEVTVKLGACGVCHSDLSAITGTIALPLVIITGFFGMNFPAYVYILFMNNHSIHHRGQLAAYLRPCGGKVPDIYGGSADTPMGQ